ncbi:amidase [Sphingorhabdus sp.]|uniref:amidase n=1 Tax=Sphingorhabdus sp. TaxID=1902408 RepID=UPI0032B8138B
MRTAFAFAAALLATSALQARSPTVHNPPSVFDSDVTALSSTQVAGLTTSEDIVRQYLKRIAEIDDNGPRLNAVIATFPDAIEQARKLDAERKAGKVRGPLHGIPVLVKDNIEVAGPVPTTAGSLALKDNITNRDAPMISRLRAAGAVILGKTNLSEWANIRSGGSTSGWSAVGGLTRNPYVLDRNTCGSSAGSGAAAAANLAPLTIGTETDGSIVCPSSVNGIVGFKPTLGLVSRSLIVPISHSQDTAGPMTRTVRDAALLLTAMAGSDPTDPATLQADKRKTNYAANLGTDALKGMRLGVPRDRVGDNPAIKARFEAALDVMRKQGAEIVDIADTRKGFDGLGEAEFEVLMVELKTDLNAYLATTPPAVKTRTLEQVIAFNKEEPAELRWFGQELFDLAQSKNGLEDPAYKEALAKSKRMAGPDGIDRLLRENKVDLLVSPTTGVAWKTDLVNGDQYSGPSASALPAIAGYPHLTVPMGTIEGLPLGISFVGTAWDDERVLRAGYAYEQASKARVEPTFKPSIEATLP